MVNPWGITITVFHPNITMNQNMWVAYFIASFSCKFFNKGFFPIKHLTWYGELDPSFQLETSGNTLLYGFSGLCIVIHLYPFRRWLCFFSLRKCPYVNLTSQVSFIKMNKVGLNQLKLLYGCFPKIGIPPNHPLKNRVFHYKSSILGYHYFWKHPYCQENNIVNIPESLASRVEI